MVQRTSLLPASRFTLGLLLVVGLFLASVGAALAGDRVRITGRTANVRLHAADTSPVMLTVPMGTVLDVLERDGAWVRVSLPPDPNGFAREGFVAERVVESMTPLAATVPPAVVPDAPPASAAMPPASSGEAPAVVPAVSVEGGRSRRDTVAVMRFDYGTVRPWWTDTWDVGRGVSELLVMDLVNAQKLRVIERRRLDALLMEQEFAHSDRADPSASAVSRIGRMLGVRYLLVGSVTQFSFEQNGLGFGAGGWTQFIGGVNLVTSKAHVGLTARLIDTSTGEIVAAATTVQKAQRRSVALAGGANGYFSGLAMGSSGFLETALGEATQSSATVLTCKLLNSVPAVTMQD